MSGLLAFTSVREKKCDLDYIVVPLNLEILTNKCKQNDNIQN